MRFAMRLIIAVYVLFLFYETETLSVSGRLARTLADKNFVKVSPIVSYFKVT